VARVAQFNSMEPEVCTILFVEAVMLLNEGEEEPALSAGQTELPHCPVCLERLDQHISGVLTTVCNHTFHCTCLSQWADSSCPVCRYVLAPPATSRCHVRPRCGAMPSLANSVEP
jgi:BRCA1-associated protein